MSTSERNQFGTGITNPTPDSQVYVKIKARIIKRIIFRQLDIKGPGKWGHWWVEIFKEDTNEVYTQKNLLASFGWWPADLRFFPSPIFTSFDGCLNDKINSDHIDLHSEELDELPPPEDPRFDPHAPRYNPRDGEKLLDWDADEIYHPYIKDERSDDDVISCIVGFANTYKKSSKMWRWPHDDTDPRSSNCRQFIIELKKHCKMFRANVEVKRPYINK